MKTIIIGAGFAGLSAARRFLDEGVDDFVVLEARDRVGGRTKPGRIADTDIDLGGMWMGPTQTRLKALAERYGVDHYPTYLTGNAVFRLVGREHLGEGEAVEGLFPEGDLLEFLAAMQAIEGLTAPLDVESPWSHPLAAELDGQTVDHWLRASTDSALVISMFRLLCLSLFCAESTQVSMLFFAHYVKSGDGVEVLVSAAEGGAQNFLFHGGVHQIAAAMAAELGPRLKLDEPATSVEWDDQGVSVQTPQGTHEAHGLIVTVPPTLVDRIAFAPALPQPRQRLGQRLAMGSAIKYWIAYPAPFWRDAGFNGSVFRDDVPCSPCFDVTPPGADIGLVAGFFDANHALDHGDMGTDARREIVISMLRDHFGEAADEPLDYVDEDWSATEWSNGCYGAYAPPGVYADFARWLREPVGPIQWAGTETSPRWTGYIDGAIRSGELAAEAVVRQGTA